MTEREREIYTIIEKNPMIEQSEIAKKLKISRSAVAVHITNMQKKGFILGRAYVTKAVDYVVGIGAANVDIHGHSKQMIRLRDSNPGHMETSVGGVTRNICDNAARLGVEMKLISAFGDDAFADKIMKSCDEVGIDASHSLILEGHSSSMYLSILDEKRDMYVAMSDMEVLQKLNTEFLQSKNIVISSAKMIVCDACLPLEVLEHLVHAYGHRIPILIDPVSCAYSEKIKSMIGKFAAVKPNLMELEILSGIKIENDDDLHQATLKLIEQGVHHVYVSLGERGCFYMNETRLGQLRALKPLENMMNATGGGDAFMGAIVYSMMNELSVEQTLDYALSAGIAAVSYEGTINPQMSIGCLEKILEENRK